MSSVSRRSVLAAATAGVAGLGWETASEAAVPHSAAPTMMGVPFERRSVVRVGIIGLGGRGNGHLNDLLNIRDVEIKAVCDLVEERAVNAAKRVEAKGQPRPAVYGGSQMAWTALTKRNDLDIVYIVTPWDWHVPQALAAMENGIHAAVEVPVATTLKDCWRIVDTSERTRKHCIILENCCYGYNEMLALNMVRNGVLGTVTHGEAAYIHNLRGLLLADSGEGLWRREPHIRRNANLYPTHGLGPVAWYMDIHSGDRFVSMVSMSSREAALTEYRDATIPAGNAKRNEKYICGDMNTSILRTALGRTIMLQHDVVTPRPYTRHNLIQGSKGTFADYPARVCVDGQPEGESWTSIDKWRKYEHPLWSKNGDTARKLGGHGGMDYIMNYRLIECMQTGETPEMNVYDAAAWSAPFPLSEVSVGKGGALVEFPDFTRGNWQRKR
jgi:predicted dehydrogenase